MGERSVRIRKVEGSTPFESIKRRIVLSDMAFLFVFLCKIVHHSSYQRKIACAAFLGTMLMVSPAVLSKTTIPAFDVQRSTF